MKKIITVICGLMAVMTLSAATVSKEQARQQALSFLQKSSSRHQAPANVSLREVAVSNKLYVFNVGDNGGFVIVSGDDCTGDLVLGYADEGRFVAENMPENLKAWMKGYEKQIEWMKEKGIVNDAAASRGVKKAGTRQSVAPLLTCHWNQDEPYNTYCPVVWYRYTNADDELNNAATGCVATATAQILYYHGKRLGNSTTTTAVIPAYTSNDTDIYWWENAEHTSYYSLNNTVGAKEIRPFDWSKMVDDYPVADDDATEEVARLMEYVGAGLEMQYNTSSGTQNEKAVGLLVNYFGYDADAKTIYRDNYTYTNWIAAIYDELTTNGPVLFGGQSLGGGHAFVLDGYSEDDFFHVNWGWGGLSDGYYRLSALNPSNQGVGGSTSTDGYNYGQCAMVNVKPEDDGVSMADDVKMTVSQVSSNYTSAIWNDTYHSYFYQSGYSLNWLQITYSIANNTSNDYYFDYGFAIYDDNDSFVRLLDLAEDNDLFPSMAYGSNWQTGSLDFGTKLGNGIYKIVAVCRQTGSETWLPCYDSDLFYVRLTVSGDNITLENISQDRTPNVTGTLALSGDAVVNQPVTIVARLSNTGYQYIGSVKLIQKVGSNNYRLAERQIDVENGADNKEFEFSFTPDETGSWELVLLDKNNKQITPSSLIINVQAAPSATTGTLNIGVNDITFNSVAGSDWRYGFYGSTLSGHVRVTNSHATNAHTSGLKLIVWQYNGVNYSYIKERTYPTNIAANGGTQQVNFEFKDLTVGTKYSLSYHYVDGTEIGESELGYEIWSYPGIDTYLADGTVTTIAPAASVTVGNDVVAIDVSQINTVTSVTPNSNPNTLYFVGASVPSGLTGKNVVQNGVAATLNLTDGYAFYTPQNFTATTATYTRTFTVGADGSNGWTTLVLPFNVTQVKEGENVIDWFRSDSDSKNFWLKEFTTDDGGVVYFDYATQLKANTPYIIAMPGNKWGAKWDLTNKPITFIGSGNVKAGASSRVSGNSYRFIGETTTMAVTDAYVMNAEGSSFVRTSTNVDPFRAYFQPANLSYATSLAIGSESSRPTGIGAVTMPTDGKKGVYTLDGRRVSTVKHGVYIIDGKKVVK